MRHRGRGMKGDTGGHGLCRVRLGSPPPPPPAPLQGWGHVGAMRAKAQHHTDADEQTRRAAGMDGSGSHVKCYDATCQVPGQQRGPSLHP